MKVSEHPLKVLLVSPIPPPTSGIGTWTNNVLRAGEADGRVELGLVDTAVRWRAVSSLSMPVRLCGGSVQAARDLVRTWRRILSFRPDVVHVSTSGHLACVKDLLILRMAKRHGIGRVVHYHFGRLPGIVAAGGWEWRLVQQAMALSQSVLVLNDESRRAVTAVLPQTRIVSMPNPVDVAALDEIQPTPYEWSSDGRPTIAYLGMVLEKKGAGDLVDACTRIGDADFTLAMVGPVSEAYRSELAAVASERGMGDRLRFLGECDYATAIGYLKSSQALALPSHSEGFPNAILEAMVCGKPVVATRVGAMPEMVAAGTVQPCGICVDLGDKDGLRDAVRSLMSDPELCGVLGERGSQRARAEYSLEAVFAKLTREWDRAAAGRRS